MERARIPQRMCVGCRGRFDKQTLLRFVSMDGVMVFDVTAKLPGRGVYLCRNADCLRRAKKKERLSQGVCAQVQTMLENNG